MRYIQTPDSPRRPFGDLIEEFWPGVHHAYDWNWVTLGPDAVYAKYRVGTIPTNRISLTHSRYGLGGWTALHMHPDHEHAYYVVGGEGLFQIGDEICLGLTALIRDSFLLSYSIDLGHHV